MLSSKFAALQNRFFFLPIHSVQTTQNNEEIFSALCAPASAYIRLHQPISGRQLLKKHCLRQLTHC